MMVEIDGLSDLIVAAEVAAWIGGAAFLLIAGFFLYLLVRPARRVAEPERDSLDAAELRALVDTMEARMEALERIVAAERETPARIADEERQFETAGQEPAARRTK